MRRRITLMIGLGAVLVVAVLLAIVGPNRLSLLFHPRREPLPIAGSDLQGKASVDAGDVRLGDCAAILQDFTGLTVLMDSKLAERTVPIVARIDGLDAEIIRTLLEEHGYAVSMETLPNERKVLRIQEQGR